MNNNIHKIDGERVAVEMAMTVKLGLDLHARDVVVCRQNDGQQPKPVCRMSHKELLDLVAGLIAAGHRVESCYEAGPCGYGLHRKLIQMGARNRVIVPRKWDAEGRRVKTDRRDAREICDALDRYLRGNTTAFSVVYVPTEEQEEARALGRQRGMLVKERQRCVVRGHGLMLTAGVQADPDWWHPKAWSELAKTLPPELRARIETWQRQALHFESEIEAWTKRVESMGEKQILVKGLGLLTNTLLGMEVCDWARFGGRRKVGGYSGLCPSEYSTGTRRRQGSISKHGNPRMRHLLVEAAWRLLRWQPDYPPLKKLRQALGARARKRAVVAVARRLAIDLWRIHTGRCTPEQLGLKVG
ncbi:MAG: IS110 family transposase [Opitutaceae bacterium]|nr:IS110 family transposase [Opitutaceae bacterium]